jgi:hypothetical protein
MPYIPKQGHLDIANPPDDFTAIERDHCNPEDVRGDEIWDQKVGELLRQMPNGWELTHVGDAWYCGRYVKGEDFVPAMPNAYRALELAAQKWSPTTRGCSQR